MAEELTYEKAVKRLEEIVNLLEKNEASLDESMKLFQEGVTLANECKQYLKEYKGKLEIIKEEINESDV